MEQAKSCGVFRDEISRFRTNTIEEEVKGPVVGAVPLRERRIPIGNLDLTSSTLDFLAGR